MEPLHHRHPLERLLARRAPWCDLEVHAQPLPGERAVSGFNARHDGETPRPPHTSAAAREHLLVRLRPVPQELHHAGEVRVAPAWLSSKTADTQLDPRSEPGAQRSTPRTCRNGIGTSAIRPESSAEHACAHASGERSMPGIEPALGGEEPVVMHDAPKDGPARSPRPDTSQCESLDRDLAVLLLERAPGWRRRAPRHAARLARRHHRAQQQATVPGRPLERRERPYQSASTAPGAPLREAGHQMGRSRRPGAAHRVPKLGRPVTTADLRNPRESRSAVRELRARASPTPRP